MIRNGIEINEIEGVTHFPNYSYKHPTINNAELQRLRGLIEPNIEFENSIINPGIPRKMAARILFAEQEGNMEYLAYNNLLREFIYKKKSFKLEHSA
jgi:hypothetical protein